jgi:hypothetical protein
MGQWKWPTGLADTMDPDDEINQLLEDRPMNE